MGIGLAKTIAQGAECDIDENGLYQGVYKRYYKDGSLYICCHFVDGEMHGEYRDYRVSGQLWEVRHYRHGKMHGEQHWFNDDADKTETVTMYYNGVDLGIDPRGMSDRDKVYVMMSGRLPMRGSDDFC